MVESLGMWNVTTGTERTRKNWIVLMRVGCVRVDGLAFARCTVGGTVVGGKVGG